MSSIRHIAGNSSADENPSTAERLLDAAREAVLSVGFKRTTLSDVARRAGVSRMTVYRTYPDMTAIFGDLMTREWGEVIARVVEQVDADAPTDPATRIARVLVGALTALREDDLLRRVVDVDPELLLPYLLDRRGRSQDAVLELLTARITDGQRHGLRGGDPVLLARTIALATQGFLLSVATMTDEEYAVADLDAELTELVRRYLA